MRGTGKVAGFDTVRGKYVEVEAYVLDRIGLDRRSRPVRPFQVLFGALAMQKWGIELDLKAEELDLAGYAREFMEF